MLKGATLDPGLAYAGNPEARTAWTSDLCFASKR